MAVIAFWKNGDKESGQTTSLIAAATTMAIEHNYRVLAISTGYKEKAIEYSFFEQEKATVFNPNAGKVNVQSGIEGLSRIIQSNRGSKGIVPNYTRVVFRDRFDILSAPIAKDYKDYIEISQNYIKLIDLANMDYNLTFIDIDKRLPANVQKELLTKSDIVVINTNQALKSLENVVELKNKSSIFQKGNTMILIGRYDKYSKYSIKNINRLLKNETVAAVPYNTQFYEATEEGKVADYFLRCKTTRDKTDRNVLFMEEVNKTCNTILGKIQEVQMRR